VFSPPILSFGGIPKSKEFFIKSQYAQGSRIMIILVKIYVAPMEALREKERQDETQFCHRQPIPPDKMGS
jgi:hypothetical protein